MVFKKFMVPDFQKSLRVVQREVHFTFEFNLEERRILHSPTRKLNDVIFNRFWVDLDMSHHEISITTQRIELRNSGSELPSGLLLNFWRWNFFLESHLALQSRLAPTRPCASHVQGCFKFILWFLIKIIRSGRRWPNHSWSSSWRAF